MVWCVWGSMHRAGRDSIISLDYALRRPWRGTTPPWENTRYMLTLLVWCKSARIAWSQLRGDIESPSTTSHPTYLIGMARKGGKEHQSTWVVSSLSLLLSLSFRVIQQQEKGREIQEKRRESMGVAGHYKIASNSDLGGYGGGGRRVVASCGTCSLFPIPLPNVQSAYLK